MTNFFKERREQLGLTQEQMADALSMTQPAVSSWECFAAAPRLKSAEKLAVGYQVSRERMEKEIVLLNRQIGHRPEPAAK